MRVSSKTLPTPRPLSTPYLPTSQTTIPLLECDSVMHRLNKHREQMESIPCSADDTPVGRSALFVSDCIVREEQNGSHAIGHVNNDIMGSPWIHSSRARSSTSLNPPAQGGLKGR